MAYLLYGLADAVSWLAPAKGLSLWRWYLGNDPLDNGLRRGEVVVLLLTCVVALAAGSSLFARRDLRA